MTEELQKNAGAIRARLLISAKAEASFLDDAHPLFGQPSNHDLRRASLAELLKALNWSDE